jgi:type IV pilus assembly protein PilC
MEAESPALVIEGLRERGFTVSSIEPAGIRRYFPARTVSAEELALFNSQLAGIIDSRLPLSQGLKELSRDIRRGPLKDAARRISEDMASGTPLADALAKEAAYFPALYVDMVRAGIKAQNLSGVLRLLSEDYRARARLRRALRQASIYPAFVIGLSFAILLVLGFFVLPHFAMLYQNFDISIPIQTRFVLGLAKHLRYALIGLGGTCLVIITLLAALRRTSEGRLILDEIKLRLPGIRSLVRARILARVSRVLGILLEAEVPLDLSLGLISGATESEIANRALAETKRRIAQGESLTQGLRGQGIFPAVYTWMVSLGEKRSTLAETLLDLAEIYEEEAERVAHLLKTTLIISVTIFMIGCVAFVISSALRPLLILIRFMSGGGVV